MYGPPMSDSDDDYDGFSFGDDNRDYLRVEAPTYGDHIVENIIREGDFTKLVEQIEHINDDFTDIDRQLKSGTTLLCLTCRVGNLEMVKYLLGKKADPNVRGNFVTPLMEVCSNRNQSARVTKIVELLLDAGAVVNVSDNFGTTAFMLACKNGHIDVVQMLIANVSLEARDYYGCTPIFHAIENNRADIVTMLIDHGFDATIPNAKGYTPRQVAQFHGFNDILEMLPKEKEQPYQVPLRYLAYNNIYDMIPRIFLKSECPEYFQDINALLTNMGLDNLLEYFEKGRVSLAEFLTINDEKLKEIGIQLPIHRKKLQKCVLCFHLHHWTKHSVARVVKGPPENFYDILVLSANHVQNLVIVNSSLNYVRNNVNAKNFGSISTETIESLREHLKTYRKTIRDLSKTTKYLQSFVPDRPPLYIDYPEYLAKKRKEQLHKWIKYTIFFALASVVCFKVRKSIL